MVTFILFLILSPILVFFLIGWITALIILLLPIIAIIVGIIESLK